MSRVSRRLRRRREGENADLFSNRRLPLSQEMRPSARLENQRYVERSLRSVLLGRSVYPRTIEDQVERPKARLLYPARPARGLSALPPKRLSQYRAPTYSPLLPSRIGFRVPERVRLCVERGKRREVLFALRRAGYSGSGPGGRYAKYRRTGDSAYSCRSINLKYLKYAAAAVAYSSI